MFVGEVRKRAYDGPDCCCFHPLGISRDRVHARVAAPRGGVAGGAVSSIGLGAACGGAGRDPWLTGATASRRRSPPLSSSHLAGPGSVESSPDPASRLAFPGVVIAMDTTRPRVFPWVHRKLLRRLFAGTRTAGVAQGLGAASHRVRFQPAWRENGPRPVRA